MAHMIYDNQIAYSAATPWHGLGTRVVPGTSPEDMLRAANLDWQVEMRSLAVSQSNADGTRQWAHAPMSKFKAVMRSDNGECFGVPTKRYNPVQNIEVARFFADFADASAAELQVLGALEGGRKVWALARVQADYQIKSEHDEQLGYVMLATSHDGSLRTVAMGTAVYVVCWNTMQSALARVGGYRHVGKTDARKALYSLKHTGKFDASAKQEAAKVVGLVREQQQATAEMARQFAQIRLDGQGRIEFVRRLLGGESILEQIATESTANLLDSIVESHGSDGKRNAEETRVGRAILDAILESPGAHLDGRKDTLWGAINGVTYYADHERGRTQDSTLSGAWFGQGAELKANAVSVAYDMAGTR